MNLKKIDRKLYDNLHNFIRKALPKPLLCNRCHLKIPLELSNNSRMYMIALEDWEWICHSCHAKKDRWSAGRKLTQVHKDKIGRANSVALIGNAPWNKGKLTASVKCICENCKKEFYVGKWKYEHGRGRFCSMTCRNNFYIVV